MAREPFIGRKDRPEQAINVEGKVGDLSVRDLLSILEGGTAIGTASEGAGASAPAGGGGRVVLGKNWLKDVKDAKRIKDVVDKKLARDAKDIKDLKELIDTVRGKGAVEVQGPTLEQLISRTTDLQREMEDLVRMVEEVSKGE